RSPMGFLSVFRNTPAINGLWRRGHDVERYLQRDIGAPLDEMWFGKTLDRAGVNQHRRHLYAWPKRKERGLALYDDGHAFWQGAEVACLHFGGLNGWRSAWQRFAFDPDARRFRISPHGMESF